MAATGISILACLVGNAGFVVTSSSCSRKCGAKNTRMSGTRSTSNIGRLRRKLEAEAERHRYILTKTNIGYYMPRP